MSREDILKDINRERERQLYKWGIQHRPNLKEGVDLAAMLDIRDYLRSRCDESKAKPPMTGYTGDGASWQEILDEEVHEAYAEFNDNAKLREELVHSAAVIVAWIEDLDGHK